MRQWIFAIIALWGVAEASEQLQPVNVIRAQIEAFQSDDLETAFAFASPSIKRLFGSAERFGAMVEQNYPMVWRPASVQFGAFSDVSGQRIQTVYFNDRNGMAFEARYDMLETATGWLINGVYVMQVGLAL